MNDINQTKKMLIVSNNPLSKTNNNGKTIASFIKKIPNTNIQQLYFNGEKPSIKGYSYFQLSDYDILKGFFSSKKRGNIYNSDYDNSQCYDTDNYKKYISVKKNTISRIIREFLWLGHWKSNHFIAWLDEFKPDIVFFVAGDSGFAYNIVKFIVNRYNARLISYITDDYIMPRRNESFIDNIRRRYIRKKMLHCINRSNEYFTISDLMKKTYYKLTDKQSYLLMNITPSLSLPNEEINKEDNNSITFIYTGSLYYNRNKIIGLVADAAIKYNKTLSLKSKPIKIKVYSNENLNDEDKKIFTRDKCCEFCGSLNVDELKIELNKADILLFVESFDIEMSEKTKYSLSTKVPEYMSVGKPIFAVGPSEIGSIDYLRDVSFCAFSEEKIYDKMTDMLSSKLEMKKKAAMAKEKFKMNHNVEQQENLFMKICGISAQEKQWE